MLADLAACESVWRGLGVCVGGWVGRCVQYVVCVKQRERERERVRERKREGDGGWCRGGLGVGGGRVIETNQ